MVLNLQAYRIGVRIRSFYYLSRYGPEFTIRSARPNGTPTELQKILAGWGDYFFYGFLNKTGKTLERWFLGDLSVFRRWYANQVSDGNTSPGDQIPNEDGSSHFCVFGISQIGPEFVVAMRPPEVPKPTPPPKPPSAPPLPPPTPPT
jgi:hypothetical protein